MASRQKMQKSVFSNYLAFLKHVVNKKLISLGCLTLTVHLYIRPLFSPSSADEGKFLQARLTRQHTDFCDITADLETNSSTSNTQTMRTDFLVKKIYFYIQWLNMWCNICALRCPKLDLSYMFHCIAFLHYQKCITVFKGTHFIRLPVTSAGVRNWWSQRTWLSIMWIIVLKNDFISEHFLWVLPFFF